MEAQCSIEMECAHIGGADRQSYTLCPATAQIFQQHSHQYLSFTFPAFLRLNPYIVKPPPETPRFTTEFPSDTPAADKVSVFFQQHKPRLIYFHYRQAFIPPPLVYFNTSLGGKYLYTAEASAFLYNSNEYICLHLFAEQAEQFSLR